ncbi:major facilitator superfamily MFS_1 [Desulfitobacterium hafniense DCB-2]|uniref:Major facilitator super MFS 1 n=2 Tax=Desulfitobacterium hafniense TaxID=49338 RepID=A0A098B768_DESHA|nr:MFS transporter [Desulfitobacterium hafniense]ACL19943.1 major facilitator superfamily MFS_1 [Desulfitobacterium hafniense DCB-2]CDX03701.1 Major facilitator super MFS 1 [Desulfitobacterium hafniense]
MSAQSSQNTVTKPRLWTRNYLFTLFANQFVCLSFHMLLPTLPLFVRHLDATEDIIGLIMGVFTVTALGIRPFAGRAVDTKGRKVIFLWGAAIIVSSVFAYSLFPVIPFILTFRLIHGLGFGLSTTAVGAMVTDFVPNSRLGEGMGYYGLATVISMAVSPAVGLFIFHSWGASALFHVSAFIAGLGAFSAMFVKYPQKITPRPNEPTSFFLEKNAYLPTVMILLVIITHASIIAFVSLYADSLNISNIGIFFTLYAISSLLTRPVFGLLSDRKGFSYSIIPGIILTSTALIVLYFARDFSHFMIAAICYGIGYGGLLPAFQTMAVRKASPARRGAATSTFYCGMDIGSAFGMIACGFIAKATGYSTMFLLLVIPVLLALLCYLFLGRDSFKSQQRLQSLLGKMKR